MSIATPSPANSRRTGTAAGHRKSGIPRKKETNYLYEAIFPKRQAQGCQSPRKAAWGRTIK